MPSRLRVEHGWSPHTRSRPEGDNQSGSTQGRCSTSPPECKDTRSKGMVGACKRSPLCRTRIRAYGLVPGMSASSPGFRWLPQFWMSFLDGTTWPVPQVEQNAAGTACRQSPSSEHCGNSSVWLPGSARCLTHPNGATVMHPRLRTLWRIVETPQAMAHFNMPSAQVASTGSVLCHLRGTVGLCDSIKDAFDPRLTFVAK